MKMRVKKPEVENARHGLEYFRENEIDGKHG